MKIFLSSTYVDLREHRTRAAEAIERLGQQGIRMEVFGARPGDAGHESLDQVNGCEIFIGIYAHRYGSVSSRVPTSITESEFDFAQRSGKQTLCFLVDEDFPWLPKFVEGDPGRSMLRAFKDKVSAAFICDRFTTPEDLAFKVASSLGRLLMERRIKDELETMPEKGHLTTHILDQVSRRASRVQPLIEGGRLLLVNDSPKEMHHVVSILSSLGAMVDIATSSDEAVQKLRTDTYHVVISDMRRGHSADEGLKFLDWTRREGFLLPTIFTVGQYQPERGTPPHAFGITNRVDELLNLIFDALERSRGWVWRIRCQHTSSNLRRPFDRKTHDNRRPLVGSYRRTYERAPSSSSR